MRAQQPWEWGWTALLDGPFAAWDSQPGASPASGPEGTFPSCWLSFRNDSAKGKVRRKGNESAGGMAVMGNIPLRELPAAATRGKWWKPPGLVHPQLAGLTLHSTRPDSPEAAQPWDFPAPVRADPFLCPGCSTSPGSGAALWHRGHCCGVLHVAAAGL